VGATTVLLPDRPMPEAVALILRKYKVTVFFAVPTFWRRSGERGGADQQGSRHAVLRLGRRGAAGRCRPALA
jgi:acyl-coenzyme A synthetase/AMP-(fatty) acid ligase